MTRRFCIILLLAVVSVAVSPQNWNFSFENVMPEGAVSVTAVAQDSQGMMWLGTESGLYSYDGYHSFAHFAPGSRENTWINTLFIYGDTVFVGADNGLHVFDIKAGRYVAAPRTSSRYIRALALDRKGRMVIGGVNGIAVCDIRSGKTLFRTALPNVYSLTKWGKEGLLVGTIGGLFRVGADGKSSRVNVKTGRQPLVNAISAATGRTDGSVWIGTEGALYSYSDNGVCAGPLLQGNQIKSLVVSKGGQLYVGTDNGLYVLDKGKETFHLTHDSRRQSTIANNIVWSLFSDRAENLWAGTDHGLSLMRSNRRTDYIPLGDIVGSGEGNCLHALLTEPDGTMWTGGTNGLLRIKMRNGRIEQGALGVEWFRPDNAVHPFSHNRVRKIYRDREGTIIVCTDNGINIYDRSTGRFRNFIVYDRSGRYSTAWAYDIVEDRQGRYWISSYMGGVFVISKKRMMRQSGGSITADRHYARELQGIHAGILVMDGKQRLWVGLYGNGVDRIDTRTMTVDHPVKRKSASYMTADSRGDVWIGYDGEVERYGMSPERDRRFAVAGARGGNRRIQTMTEVDGRMWVVTGHECCVFDRDGGSRRFVLPDFLALAIWYDVPSRTVYLGGNDGMMAVSARDVFRKDVSERFVLSSVTVNGHVFEPQDGSVGYARRLTFDSDENNITLRFSDLPFDRQLREVYAYRLEGIDHEWQYAKDNGPEITYNGLPHGRYHLTVCAIDGYGNPSKTVCSIDIEVLPPWYLTVWAKMFYVMLFGGLTVWAANYYIVRKRLEEERRAKKQIMEQSETRSAFYASLSRLLKQPLGRIMDTVCSLLPGENDGRRTSKLDSIRRSSAEINGLVAGMLDVAEQPGAQTAKGGTASHVDLADFAMRTVDDFRRDGSGHRRKIEFRTEMPRMFVDFDILQLDTMFKALLGYSVNRVIEGRNVTMALRMEGKNVVVSVEIPGLVVAKEELPLLFYRYYQSEQTGSGDIVSDSAQGLPEVKDIAENGGGAVSAVSDDDGITVIRVVLPAGESGENESEKPSADKVSYIPTAESADGKLFAQVSDVVEKHLSDSDFNVARMSELTGIGSKLLYRRIKQMTGKTPVEFIRHVRMQRAALLLREGKFSVSEVMYMVGFSNSGYFSKCFSQTYGMTPAEYARKMSL